MTLRSVRGTAGLIVGIGLLAAPMLLGDFRLRLLTEILIFGLLVASLDLIFGFAGMHSFGHAAYFGVGAYAAALVARHWTTDGLTGLAVAMVAAALTALVTGAIAVRSREIYFLMLTFSFSQLLFALTETWTSVTGGANGLIVRSVQPVPGVPGPVLSDPGTAYFYVLGVAIVAFWLLRCITRSPFGLALQGIRDSETRMRSVGYSVGWYRLAAFVIAGAVGGVAGGLYAQLTRFVSTSVLGLEISAFLLIMLIIGGVSTLYGALPGAAVVLLLREELSTRFERWHIVLGLVFIAFVYFLPRGIAGARFKGWRLTPVPRSDTPSAVDPTGSLPPDGDDPGELVRSVERHSP